MELLKYWVELLPTTAPWTGENLSRFKLKYYTHIADNTVYFISVIREIQDFCLKSVSHAYNADCIYTVYP